MRFQERLALGSTVHAHAPPPLRTVLMLLMAVPFCIGSLPGRGQETEQGTAGGPVRAALPGTLTSVHRLEAPHGFLGVLSLYCDLGGDSASVLRPVLSVPAALHCTK